MLAIAAAALLVGGIGLAIFWAPEDVDQGFSQKIFYIHVPVALTAYAFFGFGAWKALRLLSTRDSRYDLESYTAVHMGVIFGLLTLVTGSIWAKTSWGQWWSWGERELVLFLPLAIPAVIGGVGASVAENPASFLGFLALYDAVFAILAWASFEYVVTE